MHFYVLEFPNRAICWQTSYTLGLIHFSDIRFYTTIVGYEVGYSSRFLSRDCFSIIAETEIETFGLASTKLTDFHHIASPLLLLFEFRIREPRHCLQQKKFLKNLVSMGAELKEMRLHLHI